MKDSGLAEGTHRGGTTFTIRQKKNALIW